MISIRNKSKGFTLIELMIVVAIIGILVSIAIPQYKTYTKRSKFTEVVLATGAFKNAFELAVRTKRITDINQANSGTNGIPAALASTGVIQSVSMSNGVINGIGTAEVDSVNVTYTPNGIIAPIEWTQGGSCITNAIC